MMSATPEPRAIPDGVLRTWPEVDPGAWEWLSSHRLRAPHNIDGFNNLVVVAFDETVGQGCKDDPDDERATYARLFESAANLAGRRAACENGTPVVRPDDEANAGVVGRCWWCGKWPHDHQPVESGPPRVHWGEVAAG
jgi:hypothetical protein